MNSNSILIQEYLSSLKEDTELDYLFPILLSSMGFRIIQTAKESKGQSQYGKDIIAIGKDEKGQKCRWYFELKGYSDRNITDSNYFKKDGVRESIIEAKDTAFNDSSIPQFNNLPIKIVFVHNGIIKANIRPTFDGFIKREFNEGEFEKWDIYYLTDLFNEYLFNEYLFVDNESNRLLKKTLAFLDAPDYDYLDFRKLVRIQFDKVETIKGRAFKKLFSTLVLLLSLIYHYSKENDNLIVAKESSKFIVLDTWSWILSKNLEKRKAVTNAFKKLVKVQFDIFNDYFKKTYSIAKIENGLYAENGAFFEEIGYPLRCFQYLEDILYYSSLRQSFPFFDKKSKNLKSLKNKQKDLLIELIEHNNGFYRPIVDNHSIAITMLFMFFADEKSRRLKDNNFITDYIFKLIHNVIIEHLKHKRLPELSNNLTVIVEAYATNEKPDNYSDSSSILITVLLELIVIFNAEVMYNEILKHIGNKINYQIADIDFEEHKNGEELLFERHLHDIYHVDCLVELPEKFEDFKGIVNKKNREKIYFRTDKVGFSFLRYLAHGYYKNEILPFEWRNYIMDK